MKYKITIPIAMAVFSALTCSAQAAGPVTVSTVVEPDQQAAALSMWTRNNISRVRALEMPVDTGVGGVAVDALDGAGLIRPRAHEASRQGSG